MNHVIMDANLAIELPKLIGITGFAGAGKDTLADFLVQEFGYTKRAYADPIRKILQARFNWAPERWADRDWKEHCHWEHNCGPFSPRNWMQWLGTDILRKYAGDDIFVRLLWERWRGEHMVVPDVRFNDEAQAILERGGAIIAVRRLDLTPVELHKSERGIDYRLIQGTVHNDGTIAQLCSSGQLLLEQLAHKFESQMPLDFGAHPR